MSEKRISNAAKENERRVSTFEMLYTWLEKRCYTPAIFSIHFRLINKFNLTLRISINDSAPTVSRVGSETNQSHVIVVFCDRIASHIADRDVPFRCWPYNNGHDLRVNSTHRTRECVRLVCDVPVHAAVETPVDFSGLTRYYNTRIRVDVAFPCESIRPRRPHTCMCVLSE